MPNAHHADQGLAVLGEALIQDRRVPLVSATGSVRMGRQVAATVASRLGRALLELGGNNTIIVTPSTDLELAVKAIVFGAIGTAGQRCTSVRRVIAHTDVFGRLREALIDSYGRLRIGNPGNSTAAITRFTELPLCHYF